MAERRLSNKQRVFVEEYLRCWNASEAARRAGYRGDANTVGPRLLADVGIQALIKARLAEKTMSANEALARLTEQARAGYANYLKDNGEVDLARMLADGKGHLIKGYKWFKGELTVEFYDAQTALGMIGKHLRLFDTQVALNLDVGNLSDEQLQRIANGEDPLRVISIHAPATASASGAGAAPPPGDEGRLGGAAV